MNLHDASIVNISFDINEKKILFTFKLSNSVFFDLTFSKIEEVKMSGFGLQNVIYDYYSFQQKTLDQTKLDYWISWILDEEGGFPDQKRKTSLNEKIRSNILDLIVFIPSVGAQIAVVYDRKESTQSLIKP